MSLERAGPTTVQQRPFVSQELDLKDKIPLLVPALLFVFVLGRGF